MRAIETGAHIDELGRIGCTSRTVQRPNHRIDMSFGVAQATERHVFGELEPEVIAQVGNLRSTDFLRRDQALIAEISPLGNRIEMTHSSSLSIPNHPNRIRASQDRALDLRF